MKQLAIFLALVCALLASAECRADGANGIDVFYTNNPPLICLRNGELDCFAGTLIRNAALAGGITLRLHELPWARASFHIKGRSGAIFAATGRNPDSEERYGWLFQVYSDDVFLWTLASKKISSDEDLVKLEYINVRRGSPFGYYVKRLGQQDKLVETTTWEQASAMLAMGRIDAMCITGLIGYTNLVTLRHLAERDLSKYKVGEMGWWIALPVDVAPSADIVRLRSLLEHEKAQPYYQDMLKNAAVRP